MTWTHIVGWVGVAVGIVFIVLIVASDIVRAAIRPADTRARLRLVPPVHDRACQVYDQDADGVA